MKAQTHPDIVLVGAGIMSATLGTLLKQVQPALTMEIFESLNSVVGESSNAWNNAGTGHAALCELNYTPQRADGSVDVSKAVEINESFEVSKQFWSYLVEEGVIASPEIFIRQVPHLSFVRGQDNVGFLRKRYEVRGGILQFGTEVVSSADGSIAALLGASPGASTSVSIMLHLMQRCFQDEIRATDWQTKLKRMIPFFGESLAKDANLSEQIISRTNRILELSEE
jgi:L-2-hydroxyglutarate oxidase LhgO